MSAFESAAPVSAGREAPARARGVPSEAAVWSALEDVHDPEIPALSVVELGIIRSLAVEGNTVRVEMLPTFVGCPAIELMRAQIAERLSELAAYVEVDVSFAEPWTSERITEEGRRKLRASGFAPPVASGTATPGLITLMPAPACPFCGSRRTVLENLFGPTLCRSIHYCTECRQPFEQFKAV